MNSNLCNGHISLCWNVARAEMLKRLRKDHGKDLENVLHRLHAKENAKHSVDDLMGHLQGPVPTAGQINNMSFIVAQHSLVYVAVVRLILKKLQDHGGAAKFLEDLGFGKEKLDKLREILVD